MHGGGCVAVAVPLAAAAAAGCAPRQLLVVVARWLQPRLGRRRADHGCWAVAPPAAAGPGGAVRGACGGRARCHVVLLPRGASSSLLVVL